MSLTQAERLRADGLSFTPGPLDASTDVANSNTVADLASLDPDAVAHAILAAPGTTLIHPAEPSHWDWCAEWRDGSERVAFEQMTLFETDPPSWGGCPLAIDARPSSFVALWRSVNRALPTDMWLHDEDCAIYSIAGFVENVLAAELTSVLGERELARCRALI